MVDRANVSLIYQFSFGIGRNHADRHMHLVQTMTAALIKLPRIDGNLYCRYWSAAVTFGAITVTSGDALMNHELMRSVVLRKILNNLHKR